MAALVGTYEGNVVDIALGWLSEEKGLAGIKVFGKPDSKIEGKQLVSVDTKLTVEAVIYLPVNNSVVETGKYAGKTKLEVAKLQLKEVFNYEGGIDPEELKAIIGMRARFVCEADDKGYTKVKYLNAAGRGGVSDKRKPQELDKKTFKTLSALFKGEPVKEEKPAPVSPAALFKGFKKKAAEE